MKKIILLFGLIFTLCLTYCGPAAENRETMHKRAKEFQDSIAKTIQDAINEVEINQTTVTVKDTTKKAK